MHRFKSRAKHLAWYPDEDGERSYNPFGKFRPAAASQDDVELGRTQSDTGPFNSAQQGEQSGLNSSPLPHSSTMPPSSNEGPEADITNASTTLDQGKLDPKAIEANSRSASSETTDVAQSTGQARPRKSGLLSRLPGRGGTGASLERENSKPSKAPKYSVASQIRMTILNSWINLLLVMVPVGVAVNFVHSINRVVVFVINFIAIIPLAAMLSYATEEIALHTGETIGGLLNATFGNAVELIVSIIALFHDEIVIVQTSLIGSMLSNLLLVLGMCFFFGGLNRVEQHFNVTVAQTATSMLALAIGSLIIPTAFHKWADLPGTDDDPRLDTSGSEISRGTAILLLLVYACYLFFQLRTHAEIYNEPSKKAEKRHPKVGKGDARKSIVSTGGILSVAAANKETSDAAGSGGQDEHETPNLSLPVGIFTLVWSTALVGVCAEFLVDSLGAVTTNISQYFVGLILLPIIGNAAEHATSVTVACKDKMDLAIGVAVGSSMQIALLVLPLVVVIGWIAGKQDMTLEFDSFEVIVLFVAVLLVNYLIGDGKSHWLEGVLLSVLYLIIALASWFFPNKDPSSTSGESA